MTSANKSVMAFNLSFLFPRIDLFTECMEVLVDLLEHGQLKPQQIRIYDGLEQIKQAHADIETGKTVGKLVISTKRND
jgi:synaptic vesicle membrane protein VAT-1